MSACRECGVKRCDKCGEVQPTRVLPPPFGSLDARIDTHLCEGCYAAYVRLTWEWLGRVLPVGMWPAEGFA
jgi:hypothetical protein